MKRTQIYLDERQDELLAVRAAAEGRTKSDLIRQAIDAYLIADAEATSQRLTRFRAAVDAAAGIAAYLPPGQEYVRVLRDGDLIRQHELDQRWPE